VWDVSLPVGAAALLPLVLVLDVRVERDGPTCCGQAVACVCFLCSAPSGMALKENKTANAQTGRKKAGVRASRLLRLAKCLASNAITGYLFYTWPVPLRKKKLCLFPMGMSRKLSWHEAG